MTGCCLGFDGFLPAKVGCCWVFGVVCLFGGFLVLDFFPKEWMEDTS